MNEQPAKNSMHLAADGIIELTQTGYQTAATAWQFDKQIQEIMTKLHKKKKLALLLVDIGGVTGHDPEAREHAKERLQGDYDAMAVCGMNVTMRLIVTWLMRVTGNDPRIKFFDTKDEARKWLLSLKNSLNDAMEIE